MKIKRIDQLLAGYAGSDAISQEARLFRSVFRDLGLESDMYVPLDFMAKDMMSDCKPADEFLREERDAVLYHYSIESSATELFTQSSAQKILRYHNITPSHFFNAYDNFVTRQLDAARSGLMAIGGNIDASWAVSEFNALELRALGFKHVKTLHLLFGEDELCTDVNTVDTSRFSDSLTNIVTLGRIVPNKCIEELILAYAWYHTFHNPASRLIIVGSERSCPKYYAMLRWLAARLGLQNVCFTGFLPNNERAAVYQCAELFISVSRHEGYCLPLIEAMRFGVPVIARDMGGMPEAMGAGGVLFDHAESNVLAELMHRVINDTPLRQRILNSQRIRLQEIQSRNIAEELLELLQF